MNDTTTNEIKLSKAFKTFQKLSNKLSTFKFYFPVDTFDHMTSLVRASHSSVEEPTRPLHSSLVCRVGYPRAAAAPAFRCSVGGTALKSTLPKNPFMNRM